MVYELLGSPMGDDDLLWPYTEYQRLWELNYGIGHIQVPDSHWVVHTWNMLEQSCKGFENGIDIGTTIHRKQRGTCNVNRLIAYYNKNINILPRIERRPKVSYIIFKMFQLKYKITQHTKNQENINL